MRQKTHKPKEVQLAPGLETAKDMAVKPLPTPPSELEMMSEWGVTPLTARDFVVPKIFAMQAMSQQVTSGDAKMGEFRDSLTGALLGDTKNPIEFIPFFMEKCYVVMKDQGGKVKFNRQVPITAQNEEQAFEVACSDGNEKWYRTMNFYVLLPKEIAEGTAIPFLISFRSTSARAGQKLATTMFMKNLKAGKTPASMVMELSGEKKTNDMGTFIVMDVKEKRPSTPKEVAEAFEWVKTIKAGRVKVDHSDLEQEAQPAEREVLETKDGPESAEY